MTESGNSSSGEPDSRLTPDSPVGGVLSIALIGPNDDRRRAILNILSGQESARVSEFISFPLDLEEQPKAVSERYEVVILDVDSDPDYVFALVEKISANNSVYVMVYSAEPDVKQAVRFMRAGARDYFTLPFSPAEISSALARAAVHPPTAQAAPVKTNGQIMVFLGAKGGCGVTSIAANFALLVAQETAQSTLLIDFGLPLGDAGINLGMNTATYSTGNALQDLSRLDSRFLNSLIEKHTSGLSVLAAPNDFTAPALVTEGVNRLVEIARQNFHYVVVDLGSRIDMMETTLFDESSLVYLVTQVGISELRNSNRMITRFFSLRMRSLQVIVNRYTPKALLFDDAQIAKALTRPADWKIPDDYATARRTENTGTPMAMETSPISIALRAMARAACGISEEKGKKKGFSLFKK
jgi:pilus assembly protein CpaE